MERFIKNLALGAGKILAGGFRKKFAVRTKNNQRWNVVTKYDQQSERYIIDKIKKKYPGHGIIAEEGGLVKKANKFWIIDPLDGTLGFVRGLAQFTVLISFVNDRELELGVVYDPIHKDLYFAKKGRGAFINGKKIEVGNSFRNKNLSAFLAFGADKGSPKDREKIYNRLVLRHDWWLNGTTSFGLSAVYVADGKFDVVISTGLNPWDMSPAGLILNEAGAKVTDLRGKPYRWHSDSMIAANPILHKKIMSELSK